MTTNETIVLIATLVLAIVALVLRVGDNALVLIITSNVFSFMTGKKMGESATK